MIHNRTSSVLTSISIPRLHHWGKFPGWLNFNWISSNETSARSLKQVDDMCRPQFCVYFECWAKNGGSRWSQLTEFRLLEFDHNPLGAKRGIRLWCSCKWMKATPKVHENRWFAYRKPMKGNEMEILHGCKEILLAFLSLHSIIRAPYLEMQAGRNCDSPPNVRERVRK